jgi:hypothetical protein
VWRGSIRRTWDDVRPLSKLRGRLTHPIIDALADQVNAIGKELTSQGATYPMIPRATAVLQVFIAKLRSDPQAEDVPLEDLVTPERLPWWEQAFDDPEKRGEIVLALRHYAVSVPRVRPQADGSLGILLAWIHPDQDEPQRFDEPREVLGHMVYLELVNEEPDDWRVSRVE